MTTPHICVYTDGVCRLDGPHDGPPDPDPAGARVEDFSVYTDRDGGLTLQCAHYGRGCWWDPEQVDTSLGALLAAARQHLTESHRATIDVEVTT